jgi:hypothetical protein
MLEMCLIFDFSFLLSLILKPVFNPLDCDKKNAGLDIPQPQPDIESDLAIVVSHKAV